MSIFWWIWTYAYICDSTTIWSSDPTPGYFPKQLKSVSRRDTSMFRVALVTGAEIWKQPKSPLINKWIKKIWFIHIIEKIRKKALKHKEILPLVTRWMNLKDITLSEISQSQKDMEGFHFYEESKIVKLIHAKNRMMAARTDGRGKWRNVGQWI